MKLFRLLNSSILIIFLLPLSVFISCAVPENGRGSKKAYTNDDSQYKGRYAIAFQAEEQPLRYWYHDVVSEIPGGYRVRVFHPDKKTLIEDKTYRGAALISLHGVYKSYWDEGGIRAQGMYKSGRKKGTWLECEPGKGKVSSGSYRRDSKEGMWTQLDTTGLVESVYTWHKGKRQGEYFEYDSSGHQCNEGIYRADTLISILYKRPLLQKPYLKSCASGTDLDQHNCTEETLNKLIVSRLRYPDLALQMMIEGIAIVQWDIMPDGTVRNFRVPQGLSDEIGEECRRILKEMPEWIPATKDGRAVKWTMTVPIRFSL